MKQGGTRNGVNNNIWETKDHDNLGTKISEKGRDRRARQGGNRDKWREVGDGTEIGWR